MTSMTTKACQVFRKKDIRPNKKCRVADDDFEASLEQRKGLFLESWKSRKTGVDVSAAGI